MAAPVPASKPDWSSLGMSFRDRLMGSNPRLSANVEDRRGKANEIETIYTQIRNRMISDGGMSPEEADINLADIQRQSTSPAEEEDWLRQIWDRMTYSDEVGLDYWGNPKQ